MSPRRAKLLALGFAVTGLLELAVAIVSSSTAAHVLGVIAAIGSFGLSGYYLWQARISAV